MTSEDSSSAVEEVWVESRFHGRVLLRRAAQPSGTGQAASNWLVGFHGYGENADKSLASLSAIPSSETWNLAAIQAPHPFYERRTGDVVANWMTSQGREHAIADNVRYVANAMASFVAETDGSAGSPLCVVVGFSQGVAMAYRAVAAAAVAAHAMIVLGGDLPPEIEASALAGLPAVLLGRGRGETWYTEEKMASDLERLRGAGVDVESFEFDGGHEWSDAFRLRAAQWISAIASGAKPPTVIP